MSRRSTSSNGTARIAVVGAPTVDGFHLRAALAAHGVAGARVDLYGITRGEVVLSDYAGEARMIQEPDVEELARHELIFICEPGEVLQRLPEAAPSAVIIDLVRLPVDRVLAARSGARRDPHRREALRGSAPRGSGAGRGAPPVAPRVLPGGGHGRRDAAGGGLRATGRGRAA